ncbi:outer membrane beta-barrel protein [Flavobacterium sp. N3904]|uniref:outer membrane beta-barrel protein n=1 Tax=Flavobacterium sp. N3904 TaxID=2986835 RepID=UPI0022250600|nr:hypothetical protein [Flavobacterium sp. N3904]
MNYTLSTIRTIFTITLFTLILSNETKAQIGPGKFINVAVGLGVTAPYDATDVTGSGFYAQGEYVINISKWFGVRPYAGFIVTSPDNTDKPYQSEYKVTSQAFMFGGKVRLAAPIPYVAPYFEIGIGASVGSFETYTSLTDIKDSGILMHIPVTLGLALGRKHNFDLAFTYYYQPSVEQFSGAMALGYSFPLN